MDYEALKRAWIRQGYDLPVVAGGDFINKARDGEYYTFFPPLEYKGWKDRLFSDFNVKALINEAMDKSPQKIKQFVVDDKNIIPNPEYFSPYEPINNVPFVLQKLFGINEIVGVAPCVFSLALHRLSQIKEKQRREDIASNVLGFFLDIASFEGAIIECDSKYASIFALPIVDLKKQRRCPVKKCTHGRKCIVQSRSYNARRVLVRKNSKGILRGYSLVAKECIKTKQPYIVEIDYNGSMIFNYLFHLKEGKCPLCDAPNKKNHFVGDEQFFKKFKCYHCGNEFKVYNGGWKLSRFSAHVNDNKGFLNIVYLIGCKIRGLTPELFKKYSEMCWMSSKEELNTFFKRIDIKNKENIRSFLYKETEKIRKGFTDDDVRRLLEEYDCILE